MTTESLIGITSGIIGIIGATVSVSIFLYNRYKQLPLTELMNQLVDTKLSTKEHQKTLKKMNRGLRGLGFHIKTEYIQNFVLNERGKEAVFMDLCEQNNIEPTKEICQKFLGADSRKAREYYHSKRAQSNSTQEEKPTSKPEVTYPSVSNKEGLTVYMSELLMERHPQTCKNLLAILDKYHISYAFIKGTKDIWCRDYMPVQTPSGKLIQFKYDPSYLKGKKEWEESRSDVKEICELNNIKAEFSDINLDGGNVLICDGRAILSDRIFGENPEYDKDTLVKELSQLLECEIIIIPSLKSKEDDFTGHSDGMVRFVNKNTIVGNNRAGECKYWQDGMKKVLDTYNLTYIDVPCVISKKDPKRPDSAIGIYVNYLEVNDLIVVPEFGFKEDKEAIDVLQKAFPNKHIEAINYNDVAQEGGLLNCTTWVI